MSATFSSCKLMANIGRIGSILYASMGWTNSETPSLSVTPYMLMRTSLVGEAAALQNQVLFINLSEMPFNITDSLFIYFKIIANGATVVNVPLFRPSFLYNPNNNLIRRMDYFDLSATLSDISTAMGGTGTSYKKSFTYEIRFVYPVTASLRSSGYTALVYEDETVEYSKKWEFTEAYLRSSTSVTAGTSTVPIYSSTGSQTLTVTDTLTPHLASKFSRFLEGYSQLKTNASVGASASTAVYSIVNDATYGNSAIKTAVDAAASSAANAASDAAIARLFITDADTGLRVVASDAASAKASGIVTVNAVSNATYGNQAIKNAVDNAVSYSSSASSAVNDATYGNSAIKTALDSVASNVSAATTAVTNVNWGTSAIKQDTASILSAVSDASYGNSAIKTAVDSVSSVIGTPAGASIADDIESVYSAVSDVSVALEDDSTGLAAISADVGGVSAALGSPYGDSIADDIASVSSSVATVSSVIGTPVCDSIAEDIAGVAADVSGNSDQISACSSRVNALVHAVEKNTSAISQFKRETKK